MYLQTLKVKVHTFGIAPLHSESLPQKRSGMARVLDPEIDRVELDDRSTATGNRLNF